MGFLKKYILKLKQEQKKTKLYKLYEPLTAAGTTTYYIVNKKIINQHYIYHYKNSTTKQWWKNDYRNGIMQTIYQTRSRRQAQEKKDLTPANDFLVQS